MNLGGGYTELKEPFFCIHAVVPARPARGVPVHCLFVPEPKEGE